ncbi:hypothetical protein PR048_020291 [Dryococelus australis]|uniref:Uncharacterized protein n=1 Tax=Dryococelus australis TaxID=614101 RepID=A0ABQ9H693_9NEOP|nr:hypothetical protein PR048_020291 [Dryococelus australis]
MSEKKLSRKRELSLTELFAKSKKQIESPAVAKYVQHAQTTTSSVLANISTEVHKQQHAVNFITLTGNYVRKHNIPDSMKFELLTNCWKPGKKYNFSAEI